jgi:hypothetical protein
MNDLARIIHERFCCNRGFAATTSPHASVDGQKHLRREMIERGGSSEAWCGGLAAQPLNILFQVCFGPSRLYALVSLGDCAISPRTGMNNAG